MKLDLAGFKKVGSERIKIGYDPANVTFTSNGEVDVAEDIKYAMDYLGTISRQ